MKKCVLIVLSIAVCSTAAAQEARPKSAQTRRGEVAGYASRDASILSMMGWGLAITAGIATLFSLLDNNSSSESSNAH